MSKSQIAYLHLSAILILSVFSCKTPFHLQNVVMQERPPSIVENNYFTSGEDHVFKAHLEIYGNPLSGIIYIKKMNDSTHRVAFTTDFGNKLMDFELTPNTFLLHYIIPDMDKKMIRKILEKDFRQITQYQYEVSAAWQQDQNNIYLSTNGKEKQYIYFQKQQPLLTKIIVVQKQEKVQYLFETIKPSVAKSIQIIHKDFKLNITLTRIEN